MVAVRRLAAVAARRRRRWALDPRCLQTSMRGVDAGEISAVSRPYLSVDLGCRSHLDRIHVGRRGPQAASRLFLGFLALDFLTPRLPPSQVHLKVSRGISAASRLLLGCTGPYQPRRDQSAKSHHHCFRLARGRRKRAYGKLDVSLPLLDRFSTASPLHRDCLHLLAGGRAGRGGGKHLHWRSRHGRALDVLAGGWMCSPRVHKGPAAGVRLRR